MDRSGIALVLAFIDIACWAVCFAWMHRLSKKQNFLLDAIHAQAKRIENLSQAEHDLIKEVHPQVGEIRQSVEEVKSVVKDPEK
jgi:hypothetical protein